MKEQKKISFCARQGIGENAAIIMLGLSTELANKMVEVRKANSGKYYEELPDGQIKYKDLELVRDARAALKAENNTK